MKPIQHESFRVRLFDLTLPTPEENLALDDALLDEAEAAGAPRETLRLWEPPAPLVVLGRSSQVQSEVWYERCREKKVPVLRRSSGGAAIVSGPGCLMYSLVLSLRTRPRLRMIDQAHQCVLAALADALRERRTAVEHLGTSDLAVGGRKFSGNSLRVRREHLLYHGTLLYDFPLHLIADCLRTPPRQPEYRAGRAHEAFVANLSLPVETVRQAVMAAWPMDEEPGDWPRERVATLVEEKYRREDWNLGR
ncbi:MAG TPA: lipoate--protein ligase family protein [Pirellulales bacterium]